MQVQDLSDVVKINYRREEATAQGLVSTAIPGKVSFSWSCAKEALLATLSI